MLRKPIVVCKQNAGLGIITWSFVGLGRITFSPFFITMNNATSEQGGTRRSWWFHEPTPGPKVMFPGYSFYPTPALYLVIPDLISCQLLLLINGDHSFT